MVKTNILINGVILVSVQILFLSNMLVYGQTCEKYEEFPSGGSCVVCKSCNEGKYCSASDGRRRAKSRTFKIEIDAKKNDNVIYEGSSGAKRSLKAVGSACTESFDRCSECTDCPTGRYNPNPTTRGSFNDVCFDCPIGKYNDEAGQRKCKADCSRCKSKCATTKTSTCEAVTAGYGAFCDSVSCRWCPSGTFQPYEGRKADCLPCPPGYTSQLGSKECTVVDLDCSLVTSSVSDCRKYRQDNLLCPCESSLNCPKRSKVQCKNKCIDLMNNRDNCGKCGHKCSEGCEYGICKLYSEMTAIYYSCAELKSKNPDKKSGVYLFYDENNDPYEMYCDMDTDGGGWGLVASVVTQGEFWLASTYSSSDSAIEQTLGTPDKEENYLMKIGKWKELLEVGKDESELRLTVEKTDGTGEVTLGKFVGIQIRDDGYRFHNPLATYDGNGNHKGSTGPCLMQYNSDFDLTITNAAFYSGGPQSACTSMIGWYGNCGYAVFGHNGPSHSSGSDSFVHPCSLSLTYSATYYKKKWYWIRSKFNCEERNMIQCKTKCVNLKYDKNNCGECGLVCSAGKTCFKSQCRDLVDVPNRNSCSDIQQNDTAAASGVYTLYEVNSDTNTYEAYCDMDTDGGGWTLVASVTSHNSFWVPSTYSNSNSAKQNTLGTPDPTKNYVLKLDRWFKQLDYGRDSSELRVQIKQMPEDGGKVLTLGKFTHLKTRDNYRFQNAEGLFDGKAYSCSDILYQDKTRESGIYKIYKRSSPTSQYTVYCDMDTDGGGWTLVASAQYAYRGSSNWNSNSGYNTGYYGDLNRHWHMGSTEINDLSGSSKSYYRADCHSGTNNFVRFWGGVDNYFWDRTNNNNGQWSNSKFDQTGTSYATSWQGHHYGLVSGNSEATTLITAHSGNHWACLGSEGANGEGYTGRGGISNIRLWERIECFEGDHNCRNRLYGGKHGTGPCIMQYNSNFEGEIVNTALYNGGPQSACTGYLGWNGGCSFPSLGHNGAHYYSTNNGFSHACSLNLEHYCSGSRWGGNACVYQKKWYWVRSRLPCSPGLQKCNVDKRAQCISLNADRKNCGFCGNDCGSDWCWKGECVSQSTIQNNGYNSCKNIFDKNQDNEGSGGYTLWDNNHMKPWQAYCDMASDRGMGGDGGWTLVASVAYQSSFWSQNHYSSSNSATSKTIGKPVPQENYVLHLSQWHDLLNMRGNNCGTGLSCSSPSSTSSLRITIRQMLEDGGQQRALGRFDGIYMRSNKYQFHHPANTYDGNGVHRGSTGPCLMQYTSDMNTVNKAQFYSGGPHTGCSTWIGWWGSCGYPSLGHDGDYYYSGKTGFSHACSLSLSYYCSGSRWGGDACVYAKKWYWIR